MGVRRQRLYLRLGYILEFITVTSSFYTASKKLWRNWQLCLVFCVNYPTLNSVIHRCGFSIPRCTSSMEVLGNSCGIIYFIPLNTPSGYHRIFDFDFPSSLIVLIAMTILRLKDDFHYWKFQLSVFSTSHPEYTLLVLITTLGDE